MRTEKIVYCVFSEYLQREHTMVSQSSFKGTVNPSLAQFGHFVRLIFSMKRLSKYMINDIRKTE